MIRQASINLFQLRLAKRNTGNGILWNSARWVSYSTLYSRRVVSSMNNGMVYKNSGTLYGCNNVGGFQIAVLRRNAEQQYRQFSKKIVKGSSQKLRHLNRARLKDSKLLNAPKVRGRDDDSLSRYPNLYSPGGILRGLDYSGTITFALSGSITAAQSGLDVFGCSIVAMLTAVGGGTIRDAVFLSRRPFWTSETEYIWMSIITGIVTFFTWPIVLDMKEEQRLVKAKETINMNEDYPIISRKRPSSGLRTNKSSLDDSSYDRLDAFIDIFDGIGLSTFAIIGAQNGVRAGMPLVVSAICGVATSTFGGLMRDVICGRPVRIVHSNAEIYAETALAGAAVYLGGHSMKLSPGLRIGSAMFVCLFSRFMAVKYDVKLHTWESEINNDGRGIAVRK